MASRPRAISNTAIMAPRMLKAQAVQVLASDDKGSSKWKAVYERDLVELLIQHHDKQEKCWGQLQELWRIKAMNEEQLQYTQRLMQKHVSLIKDNVELSREVQEVKDHLAFLKQEASHQEETNAALKQRHEDLVKANKAEVEKLRKYEMLNKYLEAQNSAAREPNHENLSALITMHGQTNEATKNLEQVKEQVQVSQHHNNMLKSADSEPQPRDEASVVGSSSALGVNTTPHLDAPVTIVGSINNAASTVSEPGSISESPVDCTVHILDSKPGKQQGMSGFKGFTDKAKYAMRRVAKRSTSDTNTKGTSNGNSCNSHCGSRTIGLFGITGKLRVAPMLRTNA